MDTIGDLLKRDLSRKIEEIIQLDQADEESVYNDLLLSAAAMWEVPKLSLQDSDRMRRFSALIAINVPEGRLE